MRKLLLLLVVVATALGLLAGPASAHGDRQNHSRSKHDDRRGTESCP